MGDDADLYEEWFHYTWDVDKQPITRGPVQRIFNLTTPQEFLAAKASFRP